MSYLELLDWRRRMADVFSELRRRPADAETLAWFRQQKDALFASHPQSPLGPPAKDGFQGLKYWPYDPRARILARLLEEGTAGELPATSTGEELQLVNIGRLEFSYRNTRCRLAAFWVAGYGGGLFVPFRDDTCGTETYGGGRYLIDSIKSADLGSDFQAASVVLDFNYAYHPSCVYAAHWTCPLAPPTNRLALPVRAGERL